MTRSRRVFGVWAIAAAGLLVGGCFQHTGTLPKSADRPFVLGCPGGRSLPTSLMRPWLAPLRLEVLGHLFVGPTAVSGASLRL